jgi:hypothetical protein
MGWTTIIGNEDRTEMEQMQEVRERRLPGEIHHPFTLDGFADVICVWFFRGHTDQDDIQRFVLEEAFDECRIAVERPFPEAQPSTGVGIDDHELFRGIERGSPGL